MADYGVPLMVVVWTALSFSVPSKVPSGVPRRLYSPLAWESASLHHWSVVQVNSDFHLLLDHELLPRKFHVLVQTNVSYSRRSSKIGTCFCVRSKRTDASLL